MNKKAVQISQEELTNKTIRRIYNRGKRKGYVSPEYIEKTIKNKNIPREKIEEILEVFKNEEIINKSYNNSNFSNNFLFIFSSLFNSSNS